MNLMPISHLVTLYVDPRFAGMDKKWAVGVIVRGRLSREVGRGKGTKARRRANLLAKRKAGLLV